MPKIMISKSIVLADPHPIVKIALDELAVEKGLQQGQNVQAVEKPNDLEGNSKQHEMIDKQKVLQVLNSGQLDSFQVKQDQNGTTVTFTVKKPGILRGQEQQGQGQPQAQPMQSAASSKNKKKATEKAKEGGDDWDPNPWAVCHTTVDKKKNPEKYERCVMDIKKKQASYSPEFLNSMGLKTASETEA
jgi:hypothetical protein